MRTRSGRRSSVTTPCGPTCWTSYDRQRDVEFTVERHWVSGSTVLGRLARLVGRRTDGARVRIAGFLAADVAADGRIGRFHETWMKAPTTTG